MKRNEHNIDRIIRIALAAVLVAVAIATTSWIIAAVAGILLVTGAIGFCPIYRILGMSTCPVQN